MEKSADMTALGETRLQTAGDLLGETLQESGISPPSRSTQRRSFFVVE
jgi:hypothetical protein